MNATAATRCTCQPGRDYDGSEFGPCPACEEAFDRSDEQERIERDAARWRISQVVYPRSMDDPYGFFVVDDEDGCSVGIQPHPVTKSAAVNDCILGRGKTEGDAIDSMFLELNALVEQGHVLPREVEGPRVLASEAQS